MDTEAMRDETKPERGAPAAGPRARTCVGCRGAILAAALEGSFRVVLGARGDTGSHEVVVDLAGGSFGRGGHVHATAACVAKACAGGFARAFKRAIRADAASIVAQVAAASDRRVQGLVLGARRAGTLAFGEEAKRAVESGEAPLALVARDAGEGALGGAFRTAVAEGRVLPWHTKEELGRLFSRELVAVVAVRHEAVAREIRSAITLAQHVAGGVTG